MEKQYKLYAWILFQNEGQSARALIKCNSWSLTLLLNPRINTQTHTDLWAETNFSGRFAIIYKEIITNKKDNFNSN